jgi:MFS family permease
MAIGLGGIGEAFAERNFRIYSIGSIISWITYFIQAIAFSWATWEITRSTTWLAVVSLLDIGAALLFMPLGGVLADRYDRFRMLMAAYACDCLKTLVLAMLAFSGELGLTALCICAFLHGTIHSFSVPASYGLLPRFVSRERLSAAIAVNASYTQFAIFAGPAVAGWILVHWGIAVAFAVNVAGYLIYFVSVGFLRTPPDFVQARSAGHSVRADITQGARYILTHKGLSSLLLLVLVSDALSGAVYQLMPAYADLTLGGGVGSLSLLYGAAGLGATCAALWLAHGGAARATPGRVLWATLGVAVAVLALAGLPHIGVAVVAMLFFGFCGDIRRTGTLSIMQLSIDDTQRGRVMSTLFLMMRLANGLGAIVIGASAQYVGLRLPLLAAVAVLVLVWLAIHRRRGDIDAAFAPRT